MRQTLLATLLIAIPVAIFAAFFRFQAPLPVAGLGDLTQFAAIVTDVQSLAGNGDLAGAATRITDLETTWDAAEAGLRPVNPDQWGSVDDAIDTALASLRASSPDAAAVNEALVKLQTVLADPAAAGAGRIAATNVEGIAITDTAGHYLPCETMLDTLRDKLSAAKRDDATSARIADLQAKATERCNADDDRNADTFSAQALALLGQ